ncbi:hypothetical protein OKW31_007045, partial [Paraburkholderia atlantica]
KLIRTSDNSLDGIRAVRSAQRLVSVLSVPRFNVYRFRPMTTSGAISRAS